MMAGLLRCKAVTRAPLSAKARARCEPINPLAPETKTLFPL